MPRIDITVETTVERTFRVEQCAGLFDVPVGEKSVERFGAEVPGVPNCQFKNLKFEIENAADDWTIGAIVGPSGSGKSTIARAAFGENFYTAQAWARDRSVLDGFPAELGIREITGMLGAVGFASPPAWVRPHHVLSNGERFRCDLARALLLERPVVAFDEFTSVVDRHVARVASACVSKAVRNGRALGRGIGARCRRFVAVTCHYDVLDWLEPDWVVDLGAVGSGGGILRSSCVQGICGLSSSAGVPARGWVQAGHSTGVTCLTPSLAAARHPLPQTPSPGGKTRHPLPGGEGQFKRPRIRIEVGRADRELWGGFERHHYLSRGLHPRARCYAAWWDEKPVAFCATLQNFGYRGQRRVHRVVVLPDYQGLGIGTRLLAAVARHEMGIGATGSLPASAVGVDAASAVVGARGSGALAGELPVAPERRPTMEGAVPACTRFSIRTSHPGLIRALERRAEWRAVDIKHVGQVQTRVRGSAGRCTVGFVFEGGESS